jgi:hypothetical protein
LRTLFSLLSLSQLDKFDYNKIKDFSGCLLLILNTVTGTAEKAEEDRMKRFAIIVLIISIIAVGGYFAWTCIRMSPDNLSRVEIINPENEKRIRIGLSSAGKLLAELEGTPASSASRSRTARYTGLFCTISWDT